MKPNKTAITPTRQEDYSTWYQEVIKNADLAENSDVRGCMVIKPWGFSIWENIKSALDEKFKKTGHKNAYFPLFIPLRYLQREAEHVEGFAKECAVVTHHKLVLDKDNKLVPDGQLDEPLVIRPTSETIIGESFARWIQSYRDLPLLINQWANIVRWEMRTRLFLRTSEFLWQEGHTAHETEEEAVKETLLMLNVYKSFAENFLAMPVLTGKKSESEKFPGAIDTYSIEAMMQDRKALQAGTSHFLGQNFAKASDIKYLSKEGVLKHVWTTSWGVSTRLIGALIMSHSDDNGLVLPPMISPLHLVILPLYKNENDRTIVLNYIKNITNRLNDLRYNEKPVLYEIDDRDLRGGEKKWQWIKKGVPLVVEVGMRDVENNAIAFLKRNNLDEKSEIIDYNKFINNITNMLDEIQNAYLSSAKNHMEKNTHEIYDKDSLIKFFTPENKEKPGIHGGFVKSFWCGSEKCEEQLSDINVTIRTIPFDSENKEHGKCVICGAPGKHKPVLAKSY